MIAKRQLFKGGLIFDGRRLHRNICALFDHGILQELNSDISADRADETIDLNGDILSPGYIDLQVNGGGGVMFNDDPSVPTLNTIAKAHAQLGTKGLLPTLITDSLEKTKLAIKAAQDAIQQGVLGIKGLHLEGPHLSVARKGAHDAKYIRKMSVEDVDLLLEAKQGLPVLMVTLAPENATLEQVQCLSEAGIIVSLGHSDANFADCMAFAQAGAKSGTHLFNAMSQIGNREPGLVGAILASGDLSAGLIADGVHVHRQNMAMAWRAKTGPGQIFLVSDAMSVAGTSLSSFELDGRVITRSEGQLRLGDGTLAGADLDLTTAISVLVFEVGVGLEEALKAATIVPAQLCNIAPPVFEVGQTKLSELIRIKQDLSGLGPIDHQGSFLARDEI